MHISNKHSVTKGNITYRFSNENILSLTEGKLDHFRTASQFLVGGFSKPLRLDRNRSENGIMVYIRCDIPSILLIKHFLPNDIRVFF